MIKNLDSVTSQLKELSTTINSFKSEAVQVRLIELLLSGKSIAATDMAPAAKAAAPVVAKAKDGRGRPKKVSTPSPAVAKVAAPAASKPAAPAVAKAKGKRGRPKAATTVAPKAAPVAKVATPAAKPAKAAKPAAKVAKPAAKAAKPAAKPVAKAAKPAQAAKVAAPKAANGESRGRGRASLNGKPGASKVLNSLLTTKFFNQKRTMTDILKHCAEKLNSPFKSNEVSGILTKLVRDEKLIREKSPKTGNYEYNLKVS